MSALIVRVVESATLVRIDSVVTEVAIVQSGPQGPGGAGGGSSYRYEHTQGAAATQWNVGHDLGSRPNVQILDTSGNAILADITHSDANNLIINLSAATAGTAICS